VNDLNLVESIADFVLRNFINLPVYAEIHGEKKAFKTINDALSDIETDQISSFILRDKEDRVLGEIHLGGLLEGEIYAE